MASSSYRGYRAGAERDSHVLRAVSDYRPVTAQRLAWEERYREVIAQVEQVRLLREAGVSTPGTIEQSRAVLGSALVRFGEWLQNRSVKHRVSDAVSAL